MLIYIVFGAPLKRMFAAVPNQSSLVLTSGSRLLVKRGLPKFPSTKFLTCNAGTSWHA
jgi:hypothetical protein